MRDKIFYGLSAATALLLLRNIYMIFMVLPDELNQGAAYRIFYFHVPSAMLGMSGIGVALIFSVLYLITKDFKWDSIAAGITEVSMVFCTMFLITGSIWGRITWGVWWAWDPRLTSALVLWLIGSGYLMLRRAIEEPTTRARLSAVLSIFGSVNSYIVWKSIEWYRTQHPQPVLAIRNGGGMAPGMEQTMYLNLLALVMLGVLLVMIHMRQESMSREVEAVRRYAHAL